MTFTNIMTLKPSLGSLKVTEMWPFDRPHTSSYSFSTEIKRSVGRKSQNFHTPFYITTAAPEEKRLRIFSRCFFHNWVSSVAYQWLNGF